MLTNKQNKDVVNKQELTYTELKMSKSQQKQKTPKKNQSNVISSEQVTYVEIKFPRTSHLQRRKQLFRKNRKVLDHQSTAWQVVTASLGILCVALMTTVGVLLANLFSSREDQNQKISPVPTLSSEDDKCSYDLCSTYWIGFGNSYYCLFNKPKTWAESHAACAELNSHLLKLDIKEELEIISTLEMKGWIGLKINETNEFWLWEDGTAVNESLSEFLKMGDYGCAYKEGNYIYGDNCSSGKSYVCEFSM
uniref:Natural killer cells antigen CD94-like n=1 Tax=Sus scrofa TaxID=9823 RepID=A0A8D1CGJ6_PIG